MQVQNTRACALHLAPRSARRREASAGYETLVLVAAVAVTGVAGFTAFGGAMDSAIGSDAHGAPVVRGLGRVESPSLPAPLSAQAGIAGVARSLGGAAADVAAETDDARRAFSSSATSSARTPAELDRLDALLWEIRGANEWLSVTHLSPEPWPNSPPGGPGLVIGPSKSTGAYVRKIAAEAGLDVEKVRLGRRRLRGRSDLDAIHAAFYRSSGRSVVWLEGIDKLRPGRDSAAINRVLSEMVWRPYTPRNVIATATDPARVDASLLQVWELGRVDTLPVRRTLGDRYLSVATRLRSAVGAWTGSAYNAAARGYGRVRGAVSRSAAAVGTGIESAKANPGETARTAVRGMAADMGRPTGPTLIQRTDTPIVLPREAATEKISGPQLQ